MQWPYELTFLMGKVSAAFAEHKVSTLFHYGNISNDPLKQIQIF